jgi:hypothetical protein
VDIRPVEPLSDISVLPLLAPPPRLGAERRFAARRQGSRPPLATTLDDRRAERERRATPRMEVELDCEEHFEGARYFRLTHDLSTFGLSTRHGIPHPPGTRLKVALYLPDEPQRPLVVGCEVVGRNSHSGGLRLAFRRPSREVVRRVHSYLQSCGEAQSA